MKRVRFRCGSCGHTYWLRVKGGRCIHVSDCPRCGCHDTGTVMFPNREIPKDWEIRVRAITARINAEFPKN